MAIFRGVGSVGDIADNSLLEEITAQAEAAEASATAAANSATSALNTELTSASFSTADGVLTLTKQDNETVTTDLDGRFLPLAGGTLTGAVNCLSNINLGNNVNLNIGSGNVFQLYHNGSTSVIKESGSGNLAILGDNVYLSNPDGTETYLLAQEGLGVNLYYDNQLKFATNNNGINVTGTVEFDGLKGTGSVTVTDILDEDNMASDSATALATQQSIKAYVDANAGGSSQWTASGSDIYYNTGNVGIGTNNPTTALDVNGELAIRGGEGADDARMYFRASDNSNRFTIETDLDAITSNDILGFRSTLTDNILTLTGDGNVGIGTTSPSEALTVSGNIQIEDNDGYLQFKDSNAGADNKLRRIYNAEQNLYISRRNDDGTLESNDVVIDSSGRVGIGTTTPDSTLHVDGVITSTANPVFKKNVPVIEFRSPNGTNGMNIKANLNDTNNYGLQFEDKDGNNRIVIDPAGDVSFYNETDDSTPKFRWDASTERLGIGTSSPSVPLHVHCGTNNQGGLIQSSDATVKLGFKDNTTSNDYSVTVGAIGNNMIFSSGDSTEKMRIDSSGNVGIGTTSPDYPLHISKVGTSGMGSIGLVPDADNGHYIRYGGTGTNPDVLRLLGVGDLERMRIDSSGNVGIGTSSPSAQLHVKNNDAGFEVDVDGQVTDGVRLLAYDRNTSTDRNIQYRANKHLFNIGSSERMRIAASGNVGIGTTSPSEALEVNGKVKADTHFTSSDGTVTLSTSGNGGAVYLRPNGNSQSSGQVIVNSSGNVGIGTSSPNRPLTVESSDVGLAEFESTNSTSKVYFKDSGTTNTYSVAVGSVGDEMAFYASSGGAERMRIDSSGKVGIGTSSPVRHLDVRGGTTDIVANFESSDTGGYISLQDNTTSSDTAVLVGAIGDELRIDTGDTESVRIDASGNVGIGTDSPLHKVDIMGDASTAYDATSDSGQSNHDATLQVFNANTTDESFASLVFRNRNSGVGISRISSISKGSGTTDMAFVTENSNTKSEKLRIKADGKVGIGTDSPSTALDVQFVKTGDLVAGLRVHTSASTSYDGKVITWGEQTAERGVLGWADAFGVDSCYIASGTAGLRFQRTFGSSPKIVPCSSTGAINDNAIDLGDSNAEFDDIYANNSSIISSSDSTLKQDIEELTDAEERVAVACKGLLRKFRWRDAVEEKGDDARIHFGIMAQDLRDAFTAEGLDAGRYGMFISNTWWEHEGETYPTSDSAPEGATEVTRLGVRYTELLAFIISAI